eukprot:2170564-Pleurochrysis_carterae.AAC.1
MKHVHRMRQPVGICNTEFPPHISPFLTLLLPPLLPRQAAALDAALLNLRGFSQQLCDRYTAFQEETPPSRARDTPWPRILAPFTIARSKQRLASCFCTECLCDSSGAAMRARPAQ